MHVGILETARNFTQTGNGKIWEPMSRRLRKASKRTWATRKRFSKLLETFSKRENNQGSSIFSKDSVINSIGKFVYKLDEEVTFRAYFQNYEEIFQKDCGWMEEHGQMEKKKWYNYY